MNWFLATYADTSQFLTTRQWYEFLRAFKRLVENGDMSYAAFMAVARNGLINSHGIGNKTNKAIASAIEKAGVSRDVWGEDIQ